MKSQKQVLYIILFKWSMGTYQGVWLTDFYPYVSFDEC